MVKEDQVWKFQQQQFQFDIDFSFSLLAVVVLTAWIVVSLCILAVRIVRMLRNKQLS
jgi:hypothetical protein